MPGSLTDASTPIDIDREVHEGIARVVGWVGAPAAAPDSGTGYLQGKGSRTLSKGDLSGSPHNSKYRHWHGSI
eukprot:scaffold155404_cov37-Prasinocladus_malaysianus.AAC.1